MQALCNHLAEGLIFFAFATCQRKAKVVYYPRLREIRVSRSPNENKKNETE